MKRGGGLAGATHFDTSLIRAHLAGAGIDDVIADQLLRACELGALTAINEKGDPDGEPE